MLNWKMKKNYSDSSGCGEGDSARECFPPLCEQGSICVQKFGAAVVPIDESD